METKVLEVFLLASSNGGGGGGQVQSGGGMFLTLSRLGSLGGGQRGHRGVCPPQKCPMLAGST